MLQKFVKTLLVPIFEKFNKLTDIPKDFEEIKFKNLITSWACKTDVGDCTEQALDLFKRWKTDSNPDVNNP